MATDSELVYSPAENSIKIHKWKVREGFQVTKNYIILLYELIDGNDKEIKRFKCNQSGVVQKRLFKDGDIVNKGSALLELGACIHTTVIKDMCADCGADLRQDDTHGTNASEASVPMVHSVPELKVTQKLAQQLGKADTKRLLEDKKLVLLVDLDQTIIHTTNDNVPNNLKGVYHFQLYGPNSPWYHTRLRPGTFNFLSKMAEFYELHICTFGARNYAHMIAQFLDEDGKYFSHRILSRDECFNLTSKTDNLRALFPCGDSMVCIIDDREDVWNMASNLIQVKPYHFFQNTGDINAPPGLAKHELDGKGMDFKDMLSNETVVTDGVTTDTTVAAASDDAAAAAVDDDKVDKDKLNDDKEKKVENNEKKSSSTVKPEDSQKINTDENNLKDEKAISNESNSDDKKTDNTEEKKIIPVNNETKPMKKTTLNVDDIVKNSNSDSEDNLIEIEDPDDYLLYLETILKTIHSRFYKYYDENNATPDLKVLVPKIRSEVLLGKTLVFSGLVPNQMKLEKSKAYLIAKGLGANVTQQLTSKTTHLVAATSGTFKVNAARKHSKICVVTPEWLWSCAERWECVEEQLFPLDPLKPSKMRQPPAHCHSPEHTTNYNETNDQQFNTNDNNDRKKQSTVVDSLAEPSDQQQNAGPSNFNQNTNDNEDDSSEPKFIDTINPLLSFTNADLAAMNQEFDQFFESDTSSSDEDAVDIENPPIDKKLKKKRKREDENEVVQNKKFFRTETEKKVFIKTAELTTEVAAAAASATTTVTESTTAVSVVPPLPPTTKTPIVENNLGGTRNGDNKTTLTIIDCSNLKGQEDYEDIDYDDSGRPELRVNNEIDENSNSDKEYERGYNKNEDEDEGNDDDDDDDEMPSSRFRRGGDLPSDLEVGSGCGSVGSEDPIDEDDDGDWNMMGAALEREFLGLE